MLSPNPEKEKLIQSIMVNMDFNLWRKSYSILTFDDQKRIYNDWTVRCPDQHCYKKELFFSALNEISASELEQLRILEFGPYKGYLAFDILSKYKVKSYIGYDISGVAISLTPTEVLALGYKGMELSGHIWESADIPEFDIFISSDTIEHLVSSEALRLFDWVGKRAKYVMMYIEGKKANESWAEVTASHILQLTCDDVVDIFVKKSYETITHSDKWFFFKKVGDHK
jgi:hypothetical protein